MSVNKKELSVAVKYNALGKSVRLSTIGPCRIDYALSVQRRSAFAAIILTGNIFMPETSIACFGIGE